jgi:hypothetical protein
MDLQVSQGFVNSNANNYDVVIYSVIFAISMCAFTAFDYIKLKREVKLEIQNNNIIMGEFEKYRRLVRDLETHILGLEGKIGNINKNTNTALEQQLDYVNRQLLIQNGTIEELSAKIVCETEENRSRLSRTTRDLKDEILEEMEKLESFIESQIGELDEGQSFVSNKVDDVHASLTEKLAEKNHMDKQVAYKMYTHLYYALGEINDPKVLKGLRWFYRECYEFDYDAEFRESVNNLRKKDQPKIKDNELGGHQ